MKANTVNDTTAQVFVFLHSWMLSECVWTDEGTVPGENTMEEGKCAGASRLDLLDYYTFPHHNVTFHSGLD